MSTFIAAFAVFLLIVAGMAIGVILNNKPIKGSCGGMSAIGLDGACDICGGDMAKCEEEQKRQADVTSDLAYDATEPSRSR